MDAVRAVNVSLHGIGFLVGHSFCSTSQNARRVRGACERCVPALERLNTQLLQRQAGWDR